MGPTLEHDDSLQLVRQQLDDLVVARYLSGFRPIDEVQYQTLCRKESELLQRSSTVRQSPG
jgi:hypothetical protein